MAQSNLSQVLKQIRKNNHISQQQLGLCIGVSDKVISKWERGASVPKADMLEKIAAFFGISVDMLLSRESKVDNRHIVSYAFFSPNVPFPSPKSDEVVYQSGSLIPEEGNWNGNYYSTWQQQMAVARALHIKGKNCSDQRNALTADFLFGATNYYHILDEKERQNVLLLLDDGWDVPFGATISATPRLFGSMIPDREKFSGYGTNPAQQLKTLADNAVSYGYAGLGLWVSIQQAFVNPSEDTVQSSRNYWRERARWCRKAGVKFWKVDWGRQDNPAYRRMMTEVVKREAPAIWIEHTFPRFPFSQMDAREDIDDMVSEDIRQCLPYSDVYRIYDMASPFLVASSLGRLNQVFQHRVPKQADVHQLINVPMAYDVAAVMGCVSEITESSFSEKTLLQWQKIAPPFGVNEGTYTADPEYLEDYYYFGKDATEWIPCEGQTIYEKAPARMARNCSLPTVEPVGKEKPFVAASRHPQNGAYAIGVFRRTLDPNANRICLADIGLTAEDWTAPIGVFGTMASLTVRYTCSLPEEITVLVQCLTEDIPVDVTKEVERNGNTVIIPGKVMRHYGVSDFKDGDPALVLVIRKK